MVNAWISFSDLDNPSDPYAEYAINAASFMLWSLSGRKYSGVSTITEQYVCPEFDLPIGCSWETEGRFQTIGGFNGYAVPSYLFESSQGFGTRFRLRQQPVRRIVSISIGGETLPSASYYIRNGAEVVIDSNSCASLCEGPEVTYSYGVLPPDIGKLAAIELANEFVKSCNGEACALPDRISSINRQGLSIEVYDPSDFLDKGRIGLTLADYFIAAVNPARTNKRARVFSPGMPRGYTKR